MKCRYGNKCQTYKCRYQHPPNCWFGANCIRNNCMFKHPVNCWYGTKCKKIYCKFTHPRLYRVDKCVNCPVTTLMKYPPNKYIYQDKIRKLTITHVKIFSRIFLLNEVSKVHQHLKDGQLEIPVYENFGQVDIIFSDYIVIEQLPSVITEIIAIYATGIKCDSSYEVTLARPFQFDCWICEGSGACEIGENETEDCSYCTGRGYLVLCDKCCGEKCDDCESGYKYDPYGNEYFTINESEED